MNITEFKRDPLSDFFTPDELKTMLEAIEKDIMEEENYPESEELE